MGLEAKPSCSGLALPRTSVNRSAATHLHMLGLAGSCRNCAFLPDRLSRATHGPCSMVPGTKCQRRLLADTFKLDQLEPAKGKLRVRERTSESRRGLRVTCASMETESSMKMAVTIALRPSRVAPTTNFSNTIHDSYYIFEVRLV